MKSRRSLRPTNSPRLQQKMKWQHVAVGVAVAAIVVAAGVFVYLNLGNSHESKAATKQVVYSKASGNWNDIASWEPGIPQDGDSIVLKSGHTISLISTLEYDILNIAVYGKLWIDHAAQLKLGAGSTLEVFSPGSVDGGKTDGKAENSKSTKIVIGKNLVWDNSMGPVTGYSYMDQNGYKATGLLPIKLAYFKAKTENGKVVTEWATIQEENNDFFTIERSTDGKTFQKVGVVEGAGNSSSELTYSFIDESPLAGTSYYRLKQTDYDGKFEYFNLVTVNNQRRPGSGFPALNVQAIGPNPFSNTFYVNFELTNDGPVEVRLMNMQGHVVVSEVIDGFFGSNRYDFNDRQGLSAGTYLLSLVQNNNSSKAIRLIKK